MFQTWEKLQEVFAGGFLSDIAHGLACIRGNCIDMFLFIPCTLHMKVLCFFAKLFTLCRWDILSSLLHHCFNIQDSSWGNIFFSEVSCRVQFLFHEQHSTDMILTIWSLPLDDKVDITKYSANNNN